MSYAWALSYRHIWKPYFSTTMSYLNQGHFPGHHRDGISAEAWTQADFFDHHLTLAVGGGPFHYFDTSVASRGGSYADNHGWSWLYSASATLRPSHRRWFAEVRFDQAAPAQSIRTSSVMFGAGLQLSPDPRPRTSSRWESAFNQSELTVFYGQTIVNSFSSQTSAAQAAELRHAFNDFARASIGFINEGNAQLIRRSGAIVQAWGEPAFFNDKFSVGFGAGVYAAIDKYRATAGRHLSSIVSLTLSYRLVDQLAVRADWHRIGTNYDRDTDILLFGLGYRFY